MASTQKLNKAKKEDEPWRAYFERMQKQIQERKQKEEQTYYKNKWQKHQQAHLKKEKEEIELNNAIEDLTKSVSLDDNDNLESLKNNQSAGVYEGQRVFNAIGGTGYAAEHLNHIHDILHGKNASLTSDNAKHGADRIVDGAKIQNKYYPTGKHSVRATIKDGVFVYQGMQIEVPKDQYLEAIKEMELQIESGSVPGVTDPNKAKDIIKKGSCTYLQARNTARAGTIDSLTFDIKTGIISTSSLLGIEGLIIFAKAKYAGADLKQALSISLSHILSSGTSTLTKHVIAMQLGRTDLDNMLKIGSDFLAARMPQNIRRQITAATGTQYIAANSVSKLLRSNALMIALSTVAETTATDAIHLIQKKVSVHQCIKNTAVTGSSGVASTAGFLLLAPLTATGGPLVIAAGWYWRIKLSSYLGKIAGKLIGKLFGKDDAQKMQESLLETMTILSEEYLLEEFEVVASIEILAEKKKMKKFFKEMYASSNKEDFARKAITPIIENLLEARPTITKQEVEKT